MRIEKNVKNRLNKSVIQLFKVLVRERKFKLGDFCPMRRGYRFKGEDLSGKCYWYKINMTTNIDGIIVQEVFVYRKRTIVGIIYLDNQAMHKLSNCYRTEKLREIFNDEN